MKKKFTTIAILGGLCALCFGLGACGRSKTMLEEYEAKGYVISVEYNANGGEYQSTAGTTLIDMFKPTEYDADGNNQIHIKLTEPTDPSRPSNSGHVTLMKKRHFFAGWYQTRELKKNEAGDIVDTAGKKLEYDEKTEKYYYEEKSEEGELVEGEPAYEYSDYWDFENDTLDYTLNSGKYKMTLYAGWVEYFEFEYYRQVDDGKWESYATTTFDYKTTNAENSKTSDKDTIWIPEWKDGAMNYETKYQDKSSYKFPKVEKVTFSAAYTDEACTQEISDSFEHQGVLYASFGENKKLVLENTVQKIYVKFDEGERYKISTAEQLIQNVNAEGYYEILNDLDFVAVKGGKTEQLYWPAGFSSGEFFGKMYATEGNTFKIKNVVAQFSSSSANGGLFGSIGDGAAVKNLTFENLTTDIQSVGRFSENFGLFAGYISDKATVTGITAGGWLKLSGQISFLSMDNVNIHLLANGNTSGVTKTAIGLQVYGQETFYEGKYSYNFAPTTENVAVSADGKVTIKNFALDDENPNKFVNIIDIGN